jgi:hypothetical protein
MFLNPLARLVSSIMLFLVLIVLLEDWISINIRGCIKHWRDKHNRRINK